MPPFKILGLDRKADIAQIKRAYARLLRTHRPDEDPAAFQRLHEAYEACLEQARWREQGWDDDAEDEGDGIGEGTAAQPVQTSGPDEAVFAPFDVGTTPPETIELADEALGMEVAQGFDAGAFADELASRLRGDTAQAVEAWLQAHDDLYSLDRKRALQPTVVDVLDGLDTGTAARHYDTIVRFFGMDTVSGTDGWLHHRLDEIQRRFGDAAEFERVLRMHAGKNTSSIDQTLARELLQPFSWLRRLCIVACPGLPGRTGALARALRAADPDSASTRLNAKARRFWERATNRNALHRERFALMAMRLAMWTAVISGYTDAIKEGRGFALDWAAGFGSFFMLWLAYALIVLGLLRFRDYNQSRMQWDMFLLMTAGGLGCGIASVAMGGSGAIPFIMTTIFWLGGRHPGGEGWSRSQVSALLAGLSGFGLVFLTLHELAGDAIALRHQAAAAVLVAFASQAIHDLVLSRTRDIPLHLARTQTGWLWPMFGIQAALLLATSLVS